MQLKIEILKKGTKGKKGDKVLNVWDNKIAISKASGEVEIFTIDFDKETEMPFISDDSLLITFQNHSKKVIKMHSEDNSTEIIRF